MIIENKELAFLFGDRIEFIDSGFSDGQTNMDFDINRTNLCAEGKSISMFRVYGWKPWCVSLGANQKESEINQEECRKRGFTLVRRPTGGRAVLHANEITYSVVLNMPENMTVHDVYREIHLILLKSLGIYKIEELGFEKSQADFRKIYQESSHSAACFASSARYEIQYKDKKVVGSAQRLFGKTLLQHGSILLGAGHEQLADIVNVKDESSRTILKEYILNHSISIEEIIGNKTDYNDMSKSIYDVLNRS